MLPSDIANVLHPYRGLLTSEQLEAFKELRQHGAWDETTRLCLECLKHVMLHGANGRAIKEMIKVALLKHSTDDRVPLP